MSKKLFVGNLSFQITSFDLEDLFKQYGEIESARVIADRMTGRSKGFGFVEMKTEDSAQKAIEGLNGSDVKGRPINVSFARSQGENDTTSSRGSGGYHKRSYNDY